MVTGGAKESFATVTTAKRELKTHTVSMNKDDAEMSKRYIKVGTGEGAVLEMPKESAKKLDAWTVLYRCVDRRTNQVRCPAVEEIQVLIPECLEAPEYASRGGPYGAIEVVFKEDASESAAEPIETDEWLLFPNYMRRVARKFRIGAIPPYVRPE